MKENHQIAKIILELESSDGQRLKEEERYLNIIREQTLKALEKAVLELSLDEEQLLRLNRIELDLGEIPAGLFASEYEYRLRRYFIERIQDALAEIKVYPTKGNVLTPKKSIALEEELMAYLQTGQLEWSLLNKKKDIPRMVLEVLTQGPEESSFDITVIAQDRGALKRLLRLLNRKEQDKLIQTLPFFSKIASSIIQELKEIEKAFQTQKQLWLLQSSEQVRLFLLEELIAASIKKKTAPVTSLGIRQFFVQQIVEEKKIDLSRLDEIETKSIKEILATQAEEFLVQKKVISNDFWGRKKDLKKKTEQILQLYGKVKSRKVVDELLPILAITLEAQDSDKKEKLLAKEKLEGYSVVYLSVLADYFLVSKEVAWSTLVTTFLQAKKQVLTTSVEELQQVLLIKLLIDFKEQKQTVIDSSTVEERVRLLESYLQEVIESKPNVVKETTVITDVVSFTYKPLSEWRKKDLQRKAQEIVETQKLVKETGQEYTPEEVELLLINYPLPEKKLASVFQQLQERKKDKVIKWIAFYIQSFSSSFQQEWEYFEATYNSSSPEATQEKKKTTIAVADSRSDEGKERKQLIISSYEEFISWLISAFKEEESVYNKPTSDEAINWYRKTKISVLPIIIQQPVKKLISLKKQYSALVIEVLQDILIEEFKRTDSPVNWLKEQQLWSKPLQELMKEGQALPIERIVKKWIEILEEKEQKKTRDATPFDTSEPLYVENAGLILLNPYLGRLFKMLGYVEGKTFINDEKRDRAVCLLQFIATKQTNFQEYDLTINKLFCGMEITDYVDTSIVLTEKEKETCESMRSAVVSHWKALGNCSNDNLRATFLMRSGGLKRELQGWQLTVEKKAYDLLLERIPWGIGVVSFPWMKDLVVVDWMN